MILTCGDTLIDMLPRQLATGEDVYLPVAGGALFNTAIALGRLGQQAGLVTGISTDMFGEQLLQTLIDSQVSTDYCIRTHRPTTMAYVKLIDGDAHYHFVDENSAQRMVLPADVPALDSAVSTLHFGCLAMIAEPCGTTFEQYMQQHAPDKVISFDANIRPSFITDEGAYRNRLFRIFAISDIIKLSEEDFAWLDMKQSFDDFAEDCLQQGASLVILTQGGDDVIYYSRHGKHSCAVKPVPIVDTVGAGDVFNAGVLASLAEQGVLSKKSLAHITAEQLQNAIQLGIDVAALTVQKTGATPPWREELSNF